jgi:hypothetical protein
MFRMLRRFYPDPIEFFRFRYREVDQTSAVSSQKNEALIFEAEFRMRSRVVSYIAGATRVKYCYLSSFIRLRAMMGGHKIQDKSII